MRILRSISLVVVGVVVGVVLTSSGIRPLGAQQAEAQLTVTPANFAPRILNGKDAEGRPTVFSDVRPPLAFIRDAKSNGCWLAASNKNQVVSLAVAPSSACLQ